MAMDQLGIIGFTIFNGICKSTDFIGFMYNMIEKDLENYSGKPVTFFMDNASIHKSKLMRAHFTRHHNILFNAPYSPQLNPIWSLHSH